MNMELVCAILKGIQTHLHQNYVDKYASAQKKVQIKVGHFSEAPSIKLDKLIILNQSIFRDASISDMN